MEHYEPVALSEQYQNALSSIRDEGLQSSDVPIFKALCDAPDCTLTVARLAETCNFSTWSELNSRFGMLAQRLGKALGYTPARRKDGSLQWWYCMAYGTGDDAKSGDFQLTLRPELVDALRKMKWV